MTDPSADADRLPRSLLIYVAGVVAAGACVLGHALVSLPVVPINGYAILLAVLTVVAGRLAIKVPGYPATVSVSELFVFGLIVLFGPVPAILVVALDGLSVSVTQREQRLHRTLFNMAEPTISVWAAGHVFFALLGTGSLAFATTTTQDLLVPTAAMAAAYFLSNSGLTALALALESGRPALAIWRRHALYLALNYFAGASLASFAVANQGSLNLAMVGLGLPILALSYAAYQAASSRLQEADAHVRHTNQLYLSTVEMLAIAVEAKDRVTHGHIRRVQRHTVAVAKALGITGDTDLKAIEAASLLHDLGKIAIPDFVLNKPGALGAAEYERIKTHANIGATILQSVDFPYPIAPIVRHHHENWDGTGYPDRLAGEEIPIGARIIAVVDCFDAITSDRPYRRRMTDSEGLVILQERRGRIYDSAVVDMFVEMLPQLRLGDREASASARTSQLVADLEYRTDAAGRMAPEHIARIQASFTANGPGLVDRIRLAVPDVEACLFAADADAGRLVVSYATPRLSGIVAAAELRLGEGVSGWVAANRQTIVNSDPALDFGEAALRLDLRACLSIPIFDFGTLAGVFSLYAPQPNAFSSDHVHLLGRLGQEQALAAPGGEPEEWQRFSRRRADTIAVA